MADDDSFSLAAPRLQPDEALQRLQRDLRALGLSLRDGMFERKGVAIARAAVDGAVIRAARVKAPRRTGPEWLLRELRNGTDLRDFVADLKKQLAQWSERDD